MALSHYFCKGRRGAPSAARLIGLLLERKPMRTGEWLGLIGSVLFAGWVTSYMIVDVIGFQINPPRNNGSIAFMGAALGQLIWLACNDKPIGLRGAVLGYVGFGMGMTIGRLLGNYANVLQAGPVSRSTTGTSWRRRAALSPASSIALAWWAVPIPNRRRRKTFHSSRVYSIIYVLGLIPLWHRLNRIPPATKLAGVGQGVPIVRVFRPGRARAEHCSGSLTVFASSVSSGRRSGW